MKKRVAFLAGRQKVDNKLNAFKLSRILTDRRVRFSCRKKEEFFFLPQKRKDDSNIFIVAGDAAYIA